MEAVSPAQAHVLCVLQLMAVVLPASALTFCTVALATVHVLMEYSSNSIIIYAKLANLHAPLAPHSQLTALPACVRLTPATISIWPTSVTLINAPMATMSMPAATFAFSVQWGVLLVQSELA